MQPNKLASREYKSKIYVKNDRKNSCRIRNQLKSRIRIPDMDPNKIIQDCEQIFLLCVLQKTYLKEKD